MSRAFRSLLMRDLKLAARSGGGAALVGEGGGFVEEVPLLELDCNLEEVV